MDRRGFTLLELLVALGLFSIIVTIALGGFSSALRTQRQSAALISANNNVGSVFEQMTRELRNGSGYTYLPNVSPSNSGIAFLDQSGNPVQYYLSDAVTANGISHNAIARNEGGNPQTITSDSVDVTYLYFEIAGAGSFDQVQPRVTIRMGIRPIGDRTVMNSVEHLQTTVSSRQQENQN